MFHFCVPASPHAGTVHLKCSDAMPQVFSMKALRSKRSVQISTQADIDWQILGAAGTTPQWHEEHRGLAVVGRVLFCPGLPND